MIGSEYEAVLQYLIDQDNKTASGPPKQKNPKKRQEDIKKETVKENTKKALEESAIDEFLDIPKVQIHKKHQSSKGFSIKQFETVMRSKLIEEHKTRQSYERPYISVSELYNCMRQVYYGRMRYQINISVQYKFSYLYLIQKVGTYLHDLFQELYNFTEVEKTVVSEKYKVKGRIDAIKDSNLYEIKSIDSNKFKGKYIKEHYFQPLIYTCILNNEYDYEIDNITLIYIFRDLKKIHVFDLDVDNALAENFLQRAPVLLKAIEMNKIPDPIGANSNHCQYCLYKNYCEKDGYNKITPPFLKKKEEAKEKEKKKIKTDKDDQAVFLL